MFRLRAAVAVSVVLWATVMAPARAEIASASLRIEGISLEVETVAITTGVDIPTTVQTKFGGRKNAEAPVVEGLMAAGDLTGPGIETPIELTAAPGHRFQIPALSRQGVYYLQNVRLVKGRELVLPATPSVAAITVADLLQTSVTVRQLTPDELRARGIIVNGQHYDVYAYSFTFLIDGEAVVIEFPVQIDPRTHEVTPIRGDTPFHLPPVTQLQPPRWTPPDIIPFEFPVETALFEGEAPRQQPAGGQRVARPSIPAALVLPSSLAALHQFFGVILTVSNGAPAQSSARLEEISASIRVPGALRVVRSEPAVAFGRPVPIVDAANGVTFLVAQARGRGEWTLEGLTAGTHTIEIDVTAQYAEEGQQPVRLRGTPRAAVVVHDARFNINFSHPDTVRAGLDYSTYTFVTNTSAAQQTIHITNGLPACDQNPGANVCRLSGAESDEITLAAGEMRMVEYKLRSTRTGRVFATAGTIGGENLSAAVQLHMGVSETGVPLSPATLILPHYAQFLPPALVSSQLQLLGLGYSVATAPLTETTAKLPRVIKTDVFYRAVDISRAGQRVFIAENSPSTTFNALANLSLDLLGNGVELREWDQLRRDNRSGRVAGAAMISALNAAGMSGRANVGEFADAFAAASAHRAPFLAVVAHGPAVPGNERPYALALRTMAGSFADVPNEAAAGWKRTLPFADVSRFDVPSIGLAGEIALAGRWSENIELLITPSVSGPFSADVIFPGATGSARAHFDLTGVSGRTLRVPLAAGANTLQALAPDGGIAAVAAATPVVIPPLRAIAARQDLHLDPEGHKVSVLFNRPVDVPEGTDLITKFHGSIAFNRDGVVFNGPRPLFAAALQDGRDVVNLSFDHVLSTNATYAIVEDVSAQTLVPKIDHTRPAGILYGRFLRGDNTAIAAAEVRLYTGHYRGCTAGLFSDDLPPDCNPYEESPQYALTDGGGNFLFEYVPRDPIADPALTGGYRLLGVQADGRFTIVNGAVRLPGSVHFVNLQLLGRGAAEGTVRYDDGVRVANAEVFVGSTMFNSGRRTLTDATGRFRVDDLPVGPLTFSATDAAGNVAFASGEIGTPGQVAQKDLVIHRRPFPGMGTVFGAVRRSDDQAPVAGARVGIFSQGHGLSETFTGADGRFEFRRVPAGFVTLLASEWTIAAESVAVDFDLRTDESREVGLVLPVRNANVTLATVTGIVVREDPLHPGDSAFYTRVTAAVVRLGDRPPATTDHEGRFTFDGVPLPWSGVVAVQAWDPETRRVGKVTLPSLTEAGPNHVSVFLPADSFGEGLIRVRVVNAFGSPAAGFRLIEPGFPPRSLIETGPGVYEYRNAPVGSNINVYAIHGPAQYGEQFAAGSARLSFPGQVATITLRLPGDGTVRVKLQSDIDVIGDVAISYRAWDEAEQSAALKTVSASTSAGGTADWATFTNVPALQSYEVQSIHPVYGYAAASGTLAYEGDLIDHVLQLNRLSIVSGTVYAIDGVTPIAGATVRIEDGRRDAGTQLTGPDGTFAFHDVPAATPFRIVAEISQSGIFRTGIAHGSTPSGGGPLSGANVILRRRGSIEGRVVYKDYRIYDPSNPANNVADDTPGTLADNAPVPLAKFWLRELTFPGREFGSDASPLSADAAGRFAIPNVFAGPLRARAWDSRNQELEGTWAGELTEEGELRSVFVGIGDGGTGSIAVTVVDPNQQLLPIPNAEVSLYAGGLFDLASTDGTGVARFIEVPAGTYSVAAFSKALGKLGASASFIVTRDQAASVRVLLEFSGKVTGRLSDPESIPANAAVPGAPVTLTGTDYQSRASTDVAGAFLFEGIREGSFALDAKDPRSNRRARATRTLSAADPQPHVDLQLERTETLHVAVYLPDDTGASSGVLAPAVEATATQRNGDYVRTAQGNPVQLPSLFLNEPYTITVRELAGRQRTMTIRNSFPVGSASNPISFVHGAYGSLEVRVMQGGAPATGARVDLAAGGSGLTLFTGSDGRALAHAIPLGPVSAQARSLDGAFSGAASGSLTRSSVPLLLDLDLGAFAAIAGAVEAEAGGPSVGTRVVATFDGRTLEMNTDADGRYSFHGIRTQAGVTTSVLLVYAGPDGETIGAQQMVALTAANASQVVTVPTVRIDATVPQLLDVQPADGATNVAPDSFLRFTFSEAVRPEHVNNSMFQLVPADGSGQVLCSFDPPAVQAGGRVIITMRPPPGAPFPLKSNTLYRIIVSGQISDLTGHTLPSTRGQTFTTSDYVEPRMVKVVPAVNAPAVRAQTFEFHFSEPIDPAPWQPGGGASFRFFRLAAAGGAAVAERTGRAFLDPANPSRLLFAPDAPIEPESFYRAVFSGVRDLQGNFLPEQTIEFFSFDETAPYVTFIAPVPEGTALVSGVEYTLGIDLRNGSAAGTPATDVASVEWLRVDGGSETFLTTMTAAPFGYRFVAPEAPAEGSTFTLKAIAVDRSGNRGQPATISFPVKRNAAPSNIAVVLAPASAYPANDVAVRTSFEDEGIVATVQVTLRATRINGVEYSESKTRQVNRSSIAVPWPATDLVFTLPADLTPAAPATAAVTVTDVRGLSGTSTESLTLLADTGVPVVLSMTPAPETRFSLNQQFQSVVVVSDAETAVAEVTFAIDGQSWRVLAAASTPGPIAGSRTFNSPLITVPAKNVDTRIPIVATAIDHHGNRASRTVDVVYIGVNDPSVPKAAWSCPVDGAALPAGQSALSIPLRLVAGDDIAVTAVRFIVPGIPDAIAATRVGTTDVYTATANVTTPAAGEPFVIRAEISDADPAHTVQLPIAIDLVGVDLVVDSTQAITAVTLPQFADRSVLVRSATGRLVTHVPVTLKNLIVLDRGRVESLSSTTATEHRLDVTITDHLFIDCDSTIDVSAKGYAGGWGVDTDGSNTRNESAAGRTFGNTSTGGAVNAGGSHGGFGQLAGGTTNGVYGSVTAPAELGSGGGGSQVCCSAGGAGGGAIALRSSLGRFAIAGTIRADGGSGTGGGAGGSVLAGAKQIILGASAVISANGGDGTVAGSGGRVAIAASERLDTSASVAELQSRGGMSASAAPAAAPGTIFVKRSSVSHLTLDNLGRLGQVTELPALGRGVAQAGTGGAVVVTDRAADIPRYFEGHWIEIARAGAPLGTWRVGSISGRSVTLVSNAGESIDVLPGDAWRGVHRFDTLTLRSAKLATEDRLIVGTTPDLGPGSSIVGDNAGPPAIQAALISLGSGPMGGLVIGQPGAVADVDLPISVVAANARSAATFTAIAAADGSFVVGVSGNAGDLITIRARDGNYFPLESAIVNAGQLVSDSSVAAAVDTSGWSIDSGFKAQTIALEGNLLVAASAGVNGSSSERLVVLDTTTAGRPTHQRTLTAGWGGIRDFELSNGWAYVAGGEFSTIDLRAATPVRNAVNRAVCGDLLAVAAGGGYAFAAADSCGGGTVAVYDVSNPAVPRHLHDHPPAVAAHYFSDLMMFGSHYLVGVSDASTGRDVIVFDRRDPGALLKVAELQIPDFIAWRGRIEGTRLYLASRASAEMVIVDLAQPSAPAVSARLGLPSPAGHVDPVGALVFLPATNSGLIAATTGPAAPSIVGAVATGGVALDVVVTGAYAYVAHETGIAVVAVSIPPVIDVSRIMLACETGIVNISTMAGAITGRAPLQAEVKNERTGASMSVAVAADGTFTASLPASAGDTISLKATDAGGRLTGPVIVGTVPFGSAGTAVTVVSTDASFRARTVRVEGTLAVVGSYPASNAGASERLVVFDVTDPGAPVRTREVTAGWGAVRDFELLDGWAYVAGSEFSTIDLRAASPVRNAVNLAMCGDQLAVTAGGGYAFAAMDSCGSGWIAVFDVSNPAAPQHLHNHAVAGVAGHYFTDLLMFGPSYLIGVSDAATGRDVMVVDRRDPGRLTRLAELSIPEISAFRAKIAGDMLYLAGKDGGVAAVDLSTPAAPRLIGVTGTPGMAWGIDAAGSTIFFADRTPGIAMCELAAGELRHVGEQAVGGDVWDVALNGSTLYAVNDQQLVVVDNVSAPPTIDLRLITMRSDGSVAGAPRAIMGRAPLLAELKNTATASSVTVTVAADGSFAASVVSSPGDAILLKVTDSVGRAAGPLVVGTVPFGATTSSFPVVSGDSSFRPRMVRAEGTRAVVASYPVNGVGASERMVIYDIINPRAPVQTAAVAAGFGAIRDFELVNGWVYVAGSEFSTMDLRAATPVRNAVNNAMCGDQLAVAVSGGYAFAALDACGGGQIAVYDVSEPATPRHLRDVPAAAVNGHYFTDLLVYGDYLIGISDAPTGRDVMVFDRRDPDRLAKVAELALADVSAYRGTIVGSTLYLSATDRGVASVDLSLPAAPRLMATAAGRGSSYGLDATGEAVIAADRGTGISFFDGRAGTLRFAGSHTVGGDSWDVALSGSTLFVANELGLMVVSDVAAPPDIDRTLVSVVANGAGEVVVSGAARAAGGKAPLTVSVRNENSGGSIARPVNDDGSFTVPVAASRGHQLTLTATDASGRSHTAAAGPVPFAQIAFAARATRSDDASFFGRRVAVDGTIAIVSGGTVYGALPASSSRALLFRQPNASEAPAVALDDFGIGNVADLESRGGYAYAAADRLAILDHGVNPAVRYVADSDRCGREYAVALTATHAFTSEGDCANNGTIVIYDITAPASTLFVREQAMASGTPAIYRDLLVIGTVLYAISSDGSRDLTVIDISNVNMLVRLAEIDIPNFRAFAGTVDGSTLYLAGGDAGIAIVDVSAPSAPVHLATVDTPGIARAVAIAGENEIVVADAGRGLTFIDTSSRRQPVILGSQPLQGTASDVKAVNGAIHAATETRYFVLRP